MYNLHKHNSKKDKIARTEKFNKIKERLSTASGKELLSALSRQRTDNWAG